MVLSLYSKLLEGTETLEDIDNMDFLYYFDILIFRKYKKEEENSEYIDNVIL